MYNNSERDTGSDGKQINVKQTVKQYYGTALQSTSDLKTNACCTLDSVPDHIRSVLPLIHDEIKSKYYGCGSPIPHAIEGLHVLDVGCGTGRDCYIMSKLVGEDGFVSGIDMTENQLAVAQKYSEEQTIRYSYKKPNVRFILDDMEHIQNHFIPETVDLVTSNCVLNLAENKEIVIKQIYDALHFGGEFYFSDVFADRRIPDPLRTDPVLYGECLGGALYYRDFERISRKAGFLDPRVVSQRSITVSTDEVKARIGDIGFYSITYRLWKLKGLEDTCEDYGHRATYVGGIPEAPLTFHLDAAHIFQKNKPERVCGNTARMLSRTRFKDYFTITGDFNEHFGEFTDSSTPLPGRDDPLNTVHSERCC